MIFRKQALAICVSLALVGSLTACSGSSNQSTPVASKPLSPQAQTPESPATETNNSSATVASTSAPADNTTTASNDTASSTDTTTNSDAPLKDNTETTEQPKTDEPTDPKAERAKWETQLDPAGKIQWRQLSNFIPSSETAVNNPLNEAQNGKISPQAGAAAYLNGNSQYKDGSQVKDFRKSEDRAATNYDPSFMTTAEIDPTRVQELIIKNAKGEVVAKQHFINQQYSTYTSWKSAEAPVVGGQTLNDRMVGYVAIPTATEIAKSKGKANYRGHTLVQAADHDGLHLGNIELNADFDTLKISGKLTNRNDKLLDSSIKRHAPEVSEYFTVDESELEEYPDLQLVSEEQYAKEEAKFKQQLAEKQKAFQKVDITINPMNIKTANSVISFLEPEKALSYTDGDETRSTGTIGGIFAGSDAQEVVGEIQGNSQFMSFGAAEEQEGNQ